MSKEVEDLQSRLAFQEDLINTLSDQVAAQDRDLSRLQAQVRELNQKLKEIFMQIDQGGSPQDNEPPPHY